MDVCAHGIHKIRDFDGLAAAMNPPSARLHLTTRKVRFDLQGEGYAANFRRARHGSFAGRQQQVAPLALSRGRAAWWGAKRRP